MLPVKPLRQTFLRRSPPEPRWSRSFSTDQTREVAENTPAGTNIGAPVTASDTDVLTYSLLRRQRMPESFGINRATGQLIVTKAALDHEPRLVMPYRQ